MLTLGAAAQAREAVGVLWMLDNDAIGDGGDRWRSGSVQLGVVLGRNSAGLAAFDLGDFLELRFAAEVISPEELDTLENDRPLAGAISFGVHTGARRGPVDLSVGADLTFIGPQTGLDQVLEAIHPSLSDDVKDRQIGPTLIPTVSGEMARAVPLGPGVLRPFAELRAGVETLARVGADIVLGPGLETTLPARDVVTGHPLWLTGARTRGFTVVVGADIAQVFDSVYLSGNDAPPLERQRLRARAGALYRGDFGGVFYGLTWLGEEFEGQREPQLVGSLSFELQF